jgi:hypothetical protein
MDDLLREKREIPQSGKRFNKPCLNKAVHADTIEASA